MNCNEARDLIHDVVDGVAGKDGRARLQAHAATCADCAGEWRAQQALVRHLSRMELEDVPRGFGDRVIEMLRASGRIVERTPVHGAWQRAFGWMPARVRVPAAALLMLVIAVSLFPSTIGPLEEMAGETVVAVTNTFISIQDKVASVEVVSRLAEGFARNLRTLRVIALAGFSLLSRAGEMFLLPLLAMLAVFLGGVYWYYRSIHKRGAHHATFTF